MKQVWPYIVFSTLFFIIVITNYVPGTWLTGWDNLHPEFDFGLNIKRTIFAVWQEYQGLGLLGGMAHASDLVRQIFLWVTSAILPVDLIRYFYHFFMLMVGTMGMYSLMSYIMLKDLKGGRKQAICLLAALSYLFNLGSIQYVYMPFEPYSTFWGMFPWLMLSFFQYIKGASHKFLAFFLLINILATPSFYVQSIFLVYILVISLCLIIFAFSIKTKEAFKKAIVTLLIIIGVNSFWLLPNLYFIKNNAWITQKAMQNQMVTERFYQTNKKYGNLLDFALLREFYIDLQEVNQETGQLEFIMKPWRDHFSSPIVLFIGYSIFAISLIGLFSKNKYRIYHLILFFFCASIFLSDTAGFSLINDIFRLVPIINQVLRNPFTKFAVVAIYIFSVGFGLGVLYICTRLEAYIGTINNSILQDKRQTKQSVINGFVFVLVVLLLIYGFPMIAGKLFAGQLKVAIPNDYFQLFAFFKTQEKTARIANLPQTSYWGWNHYKFGTVGSGFIWYGIEQPIMDRAFDVWSDRLEDYYWQLSYALQVRDKKLFNDIVKKYQIGYIVVDENLVPYGDSRTIKVAQKQSELLYGNELVEEIARFGNIKVYSTTINEEWKSYINTFSNVPRIQTSEPFQLKDTGFGKANIYMQGSENDYNYYYPFGSLFTYRLGRKQNFDISESETDMVFTSEIGAGSYSLRIPAITQDLLLPALIHIKKSGNNIVVRITTIPPTVEVGGQAILQKTIVKEIELPMSSESLYPLFLSINNRDFFKIAEADEEYTMLGSTYFPVGMDNQLRVYESRGSESYNLAFKNFESPVDCGGDKVDKQVQARVENDELVLNVKNTSLCMSFNAPFTNGGPTLSEVTYSYRSYSDEFPQYCFRKDLETECLNKKDVIANGFGQNWELLTSFFENDFYPGDIFRFQLNLEGINIADDNISKEIRIKDIFIHTYPLASQNIVRFEAGDSQATTISDIDIINTSTIQMRLPKLSNSYTFTQPIKRNLFKTTSLNLDANATGKYSLSQQETSNGQKFLSSIAQDASSYILLHNSEFEPKYGYLVNIQTKNKNGFPFIASLSTKKERRNYIYTYLDKTNTFSDNYFVLPPVYEFDKGLDITLISTSYNMHPTVNDLLDLEIIPTAYNFISKLYFTKDVWQKSSPEEKAEMVISNVQKLNESLYTLEISPGEKGYPKNPIIALSQSYDKGWKAYDISCQMSEFGCQLRMIMPFMFFKELQDHVLVNNWENGWEFSNQLSEFSNQQIDLPTTENRQLITILLVYLPQYLEYIGFGLLGLTILIVSLQAVKLHKA